MTLKKMAGRGLSALLAIVLLVFINALQLGAQNPAVGARSSTPGGSTATLKVGDAAPDFELPDQNSKMVHLSDFKGKKNVVLAFYVLAFTGG